MNRSNTNRIFVKQSVAARGFYIVSNFVNLSSVDKGLSIKDVRMRGRGLANADACVNFACKRPNFADGG